MTLLELRTRLRSRLDDLNAPYLWPDAELDEYLNDAQSEACVRASLIRDMTSAATSLSVVAGTDTYTLDVAIYRTHRVKLALVDCSLVPTTIADLDYDTNGWEGLTGTPTHWYSTGAPNKITLWPNPVVNDTASLVVYRTALAAMSDDAHTPEIEEIYHADLVDWGMHLAFLKRDSETFNQKSADEYEFRFERRFGRRPTAKNRQMRRVGSNRSSRAGFM